MCKGMFDRDRSGSIELHEFQALWGYIGQWRQVFDQYDRDRSGAIDGNELHNSKLIFCHDLLIYSYFVHRFCHHLGFFGKHLAWLKIIIGNSSSSPVITKLMIAVIMYLQYTL